MEDEMLSQIRLVNRQRDADFEKVHGLNDTVQMFIGRLDLVVVLFWIPNTKKVGLVREDAFLQVPKDRYTRWVKITKNDNYSILTSILLEAMHLIVRDGCCPYAVHKALAGHYEYRNNLALDTPLSRHEQFYEVEFGKEELDE